MPPKRKAATTKTAAKKAPPSKKAKKTKEAEEEEEAGPSDLKKAIENLKKSNKGKKTHKVDALCPLTGSGVHLDYDCMLNQTNIGGNNNKYYVIQVLTTLGKYYTWNRWGRVGENGQNALKGPFGDPEKAIADFKKKFKDKTKNAWENRASFVTHPGKYTLIEMGDEEEDDNMQEKMAKLDEIDGVDRIVAECKLPKATQSLIKLIFDQDMFKEAMATMEIDLKKMPLGKLSKVQIAKGFECLEEIEELLKKKGNPPKNKLEQLSSNFYTAIPHDFGRQRPPSISTDEQLKKKYDMLLVLGDIEMAQTLQKEKKASLTGEVNELPHPLDQNYDTLNCGLELVDKKSKEFKVIETYTKNTSGGWRVPTIQEVWRVNRDGEDTRFSAHKKLDNRKLLWHGTNVAVVAAILKSGMRIMPHSGGRVGRGIYFASENSKSAGYVRCAGNTGIMFLNEVALGEEHHITMDDWRLTAAPPGYDCIIAKGHTEPDPKKDTTLTIEGNKVTVPQGKPIKMAEYASSSFSQSEYLVYKESQARIRYLLKMNFK